MASTIILLLIAFLLGSIPNAVWLGKGLKGIDVRQKGSGNPGATNAIRILGWRLGLVILFLDILKGFLAAWILPNYAPAVTDSGEVKIKLALALAAVLGHMFSPFLSFKGGKGVATACGCMLALAPAATGLSLLIFFSVTLTTRYVALASIIAAFSLPVWVWILQPQPKTPILLLTIVLALFILWAHRSNLDRLRKGKESKFF